MERKKVNATLLSVKGKRSYNSFTNKERFLIGKYASLHQTHIYKPLDLTMNCSANAFFLRRFSKWYSSEIHGQLDEGK